MVLNLEIWRPLLCSFLLLTCIEVKEEEEEGGGHYKPPPAPLDRLGEEEVEAQGSTTSGSWSQSS